MAQPDMEHKYKVEEATRTLIKSEEIKKDKKLYAECQKEMGKQHQALMMAMGNMGNGKALRDMVKMNEHEEGEY